MGIKRSIVWSLVTTFSVATILCCCAGQAVQALSFSKNKSAVCCSKSEKSKSHHKEKCPDCEKQYLKAENVDSSIAILKSTPYLPSIMGDVRQQFSHPVFAHRLSFQNGPPFSPGPALFISYHQLRI
jgi:hypothetical protein